jgi:dienelactone hydrolase
MQKVRTLSRRNAIGYIAAAGLYRPASAWANGKPQEVDKPFGWLMSPFQGRPVYMRGKADRVVVLLHEINGLSPGCVDLGVELVEHGFTVFMPLFFGHPDQDSTWLGFVESCGFGHFHCLADGGKAADTGPVRWTRDFIDHLCAQAEVRTIGLIGMCQTGAFPLAAMKEDTKVKGVIMSQPALPFGKDRQKNVGIAETTMKTAHDSKIPILAFRFNADSLCTADRFKFLEGYFGTEQFQGRSFDCPGVHGSMNHRLHAVLTGPCRAVREEARHKAVAFLSDKLG